MVAQREAFGRTLVELADADDRAVVLDGDLANSTKADIFAEAHTERFLAMGIAEQNMAGVAAGLATGTCVGAAAAGALVGAAAAGADVGAAAGGALGAHAARTPRPMPSPLRPNAVNSWRRCRRNLERSDDSFT